MVESEVEQSFNLCKVKLNENDLEQANIYFLNLIEFLITGKSNQTFRVSKKSPVINAVHEFQLTYYILDDVLFKLIVKKNSEIYVQSIVENIVEMVQSAPTICAEFNEVIDLLYQIKICSSNIFINKLINSNFLSNKIPSSFRYILIEQTREYLHLDRCESINFNELINNYYQNESEISKWSNKEKFIY